MGGRKKTQRKPAPKQANQKLPTIFDCPFCNNRECIEVKM
jgi:transcription elongation factor Elf1